MEYIVGIGIILFGLIALFATTFKYTKNEHKNDNFSNGSTDLVGFIFSLIMSIFPWWLAKAVLILMSVGIIFVGIMVLLTM